MGGTTVHTTNQLPLTRRVTGRLLLAVLAPLLLVALLVGIARAQEPMPYMVADINPS